jgi:hypothetical protein
MVTFCSIYKDSLKNGNNPMFSRSNDNIPQYCEIKVNQRGRTGNPQVFGD